MAHLLNKRIAIVISFCFFEAFAFAQSTVEIVPEYKDYKDKEQFEKFHKRAKNVAAWQINELKEGALVIRLKTNKKIIDALTANGNSEMAKRKTIETYLYNKNVMKAYYNSFNFCKVYFIYSHSSDSLLKGMRQGIFLDTNLLPDATIAMKEKFYLIAERDYAYNSSIGFVPEDSATLVNERGTPVREMGVVVKNKYGHQLKYPFPFKVKDRTVVDYGVPGKAISIMEGRVHVWVPEADEDGQKQLNARTDGGTPFYFELKKGYTYKNINIYVEEFNENLYDFYRRSPKTEKARINPKIQPYLY